MFFFQVVGRPNVGYIMTFMLVWRDGFILVKDWFYCRIIGCAHGIVVKAKRCNDLIDQKILSHFHRAVVMLGKFDTKVVL